jgi:hypothetical protein
LQNWAIANNCRIEIDRWGWCRYWHWLSGDSTSCPNYR